MKSRQMTDGDAVSVAEKEGLTLLLSDNKSGFRYVNERKDGGHQVKLVRNGKRHRLGTFGTPEEAAMRVARWLRDNGSTEAAEYAKPRPMTAIEAVDAAATECLVLVRAKNETGFRSVFYEKRNNRYQAKPRQDGKPRSIGYFNTPEEAALRVARSLHEYVLTDSLPKTRACGSVET